MNSFGVTLPLAITLFLSGYAFSAEYFDELTVEMGDELDTEFVALKMFRQNIVGKSDEEIAAMLDKNGDGVLSKEELKQDLVDMTDVAFDEVDIDELNLVWDSLVGPKETIDMKGGSDMGEYLDEFTLEMGDELDTEILALKDLRQNIVGKSDEEVAAMMDKNGDGVLSKEELKQGLIDLTGVGMDEVDMDLLNLGWDSLVGPKEIIDMKSGSDMGEYLDEFTLEMGDELDTEILALKNLRQNIVGKSDEEVAAMMDKNGDGVLSKEELKQGLIDLTGVGMDEVDMDLLNLVWDSLVGPKGTIEEYNYDEDYYGNE